MVLLPASPTPDKVLNASSNAPNEHPCRSHIILSEAISSKEHTASNPARVVSQLPTIGVKSGLSPKNVVTLQMNQTMIHFNQDQLFWSDTFSVSWFKEGFTPVLVQTKQNAIYTFITNNLLTHFLEFFLKIPCEEKRTCSSLHMEYNAPCSSPQVLRYSCIV